MIKICLCGRPNVGKSSLFNRLIGKKKALVLDFPGVTRDVKIDRLNWKNETWEIADLAGLEIWGERTSKDTEELRRLSMEAALRYLEDADLALFVIDGRSPLLPLDFEIAILLRSRGKKVLPVLSKAEGRVLEDALADVSELGWGNPIPTSAEHNLGIENLVEEISARLPKTIQEAEPVLSDSEESVDTNAESKSETVVVKGETPARPITLGVYGRPNVGKSTLVNSILGQSRMITSPIAGTTVDAIDSDFENGGVYYRLVDTAGIRRRSRTEKGVETLSIVQAVQSLERADIALFVIDGYEGVTDQDEKVAGEILKTGRSVIMIVNKWDLCRVDKKEYAQKVREAVPFLDFAPLLFTCAEKSQGLEPLFDLIDEILKQRYTIATTGELNRVLQRCEPQNNPKNAKFYYALQTSKNPPTITIQVNDPEKVHFAFERFVKNELRRHFGWMGSPLRLVFRSRK